MTGATSGVGTSHPSGAPEFTNGFSGVRAAKFLVFCVVFRRSLFVLSPFYFGKLYCLSFDLRLLIIHLVSSNLSYSANLVKHQLTERQFTPLGHIRTDSESTSYYLYALTEMEQIVILVLMLIRPGI